MHDEREDELSEHIVGLRRGDPRSARLVVSALEPSLRRTLTRLLRSPVDVDDVLQESLWALFRALPRFRGETTLAKFASRIARLQAITKLRRTRRESARDWVFGIAQEISSEPPRAPHEELVQRELAGRLNELRGRLPVEQAEVLLMRFVYDYSLTEIAAETNALPNTVRTRLRLGRAMMRRLLLLDAEAGVRAR
jgi:RNA polymerase sigma-70 factor (ECF subfamily)